MSSARVFVVAFVACIFVAVMLLSSSSSSSSPTSAQGEVAASTPSPPVSTPTPSLPDASLPFHLTDPDLFRDIVFSCFFFRPDFYHGRKVPSLQWIVVMIESAFEFRRKKRCTDKSTTTMSSRDLQSFCDLRVVMFVDGNTRDRLSALIKERARGSLRRPDFLDSSLAFLELVLVDPENDAEFAKIYNKEDWANPERLGNSANNFRFWLIRRYMRQLWQRAVMNFRDGSKKKRSSTASGVLVRPAAASAKTVDYDKEVTYLDPRLTVKVHQLDNEKDEQQQHHNHQQQNDEEEAAASESARKRQQLSRIRILISDATDVLFQRNPFDDGVCFPSSSSNHIFLFTLEHSSKNFKNEKYNRRWMKCYDKKKTAGSSSTSPLRDMARLRMRVSCAGVSLGSFFGVLTYLNAQLNEISDPALTACAVEDIKAALDQATHNFLMYEGIWQTNDQQHQQHQQPQQSKKAGWHESWAIAARRVAVGLGTEQFERLSIASVPSFDERQSSSKWDRWAQLKVRGDSDGRPLDVWKHAAGDGDALRWQSSDASDACVFHGNFAPLQMNADGSRVATSKSGGGEFAIVHQYTSDRHPRVMKAANERYKI